MPLDRLSFIGSELAITQHTFLLPCPLLFVHFNVTRGTIFIIYHQISTSFSSNSCAYSLYGGYAVTLSFHLHNVE
ncbi:hypothetical protein D3C76_740210 [compost metagenome]